VRGCLVVIGSGRVALEHRYLDGHLGDGALLHVLRVMMTLCQSVGSGESPTLTAIWAAARFCMCSGSSFSIASSSMGVRLLAYVYSCGSRFSCAIFTCATRRVQL